MIFCLSQSVSSLYTNYGDILDLIGIRAITWLIMAISPLCSNSRETRGTSGENYIEKDCDGERENAEI